jgi:anhydro-N-acetylmuramic acid kinase
MSPPLKSSSRLSRVSSNAEPATFHVMGLMSGTSLDGLDIGVSVFQRSGKQGGWSGILECFVSIPFPESWRNRLKELPAASVENWFVTSIEWTQWCADQILATGWISEVDLVVFPGQTVFHRPHEGWTGQLGSGAHLHAALNGVPVVCDLRSLDVAYNGQGAPLVPIVEEHLYAAFDGCLNLGGIANFSCVDEETGNRVAWDIGPCNLLLNHLAARVGHVFDEDGHIAAKGHVLPALFERFLALEFHAMPLPKSIGREWIEDEVLPLLDLEPDASVEDLMATAVAYIASVVRLAAEGKHTLVTGGGAYNGALIDALKSNSSAIRGLPVDVVIPQEIQVEGKEAHAFAFLGLLRVLGEPNALPSVTGSRQASSGGALWGTPRFLRR